MMYKSTQITSWLIQLLPCFTMVIAASLYNDPDRDSTQQRELNTAALTSHSTTTPEHSNRNTDNFQFPTSANRSPSFVLSNQHLCRSDTYLVIVVCSSAENFKQREAIRETWGSVSQDPKHRTKVLFLLGLPNRERHNSSAEQIQKDIRVEYKLYGDIVQADFEDSYRNLSLKSVAMLKWMHNYCKQVTFLLKTDDDVFINANVLLKDLHNCVHSRFIMGNIIAGAQPIQDKNSKWFTPKSLYPEERYPKYISGTAYVISGDLISDLYKVTQETDIFLWEDIYITGICAKKLDAKHVFNPKFGFKKRISDPCLFQLLITGHRMSPDEQRHLWDRMQDPKLVCPYPERHL